MFKLSFLFTLFALTALTLSGCGGTDDSTPAPEPEVEDPSTPAPDQPKADGGMEDPEDMDPPEEEPAAMTPEDVHDVLSPLEGRWDMQNGHIENIYTLDLECEMSEEGPGCFLVGEATHRNYLGNGVFIVASELPTDISSQAEEVLLEITLDRQGDELWIQIYTQDDETYMTFVFTSASGSQNRFDFTKL